VTSSGASAATSSSSFRRRAADAEQAMTTARRLAETFDHQVRPKAGHLWCRARIGVAWSSDPALDAESLVAMADSSMYEAKRSGRGVPVLHQRDTASPGRRAEPWSW
jgi:PleD family two-component response regulator